MKFSGKLFKIQTKISASAFIVLAAVSAGSAMAGDEVESGSHLSRVSSPDLADGYYSPLQERVGRASRSYGSDVSDSPVSPVFGTERVIRKNNAPVIKRADPLKSFIPRSFANSFKLQLKESPQKFGEAIRASSSTVSAPEPLAKSKQKRASMPSQEVQTDDLLTFVPFSTVVSEWRSLPHEDVVHAVQDFSPAAMYVSPEKRQNLQHRDVKGDIADADEEVISPVVKRGEEQDARDRAAQSGTVSQKLFTEGSALVVRDVSSVFSSDSALFARSEDQFTLVGGDLSFDILGVAPSHEITLAVAGVDRTTTIEEMLSAVEVGGVNQSLTYQKHFFHCLKLSEGERKKYLRALLKKPEFLGETEATVLGVLQERADSAYFSLRKFFIDGNLRDKTHIGLIQKILAESQMVIDKNSTLRRSNNALVTTLRQAFANSELVKAFSENPQGVLSLDTSEWTASQFSMCLEFIINEFTKSQKAVSELSSANEALSHGNDELATAGKELTISNQELVISNKKLLSILEERIADHKLEKAELSESLKHKDGIIQHFSAEKLELAERLSASEASVLLLRDKELKLQEELRNLRSLQKSWEEEKASLTERLSKVLAENRQLKSAKNLSATRK